MKLYSRNFVRVLHRHALAIIKPQPDLRKEYKLRRKRLNVRRKWILLAVYLCLGCGALVLRASASPEFTYIFIAAYGTATVLLRSATFAGRLRRSNELSVFTGLPIADDEFFDLQWMKFFRNTFWALVLVLAAYFTRAQVGTHSQGADLGFSLLCSIAQWGMIVSLGVAMLYTRNASIGWIAIVLNACVVASLVLPPEFGHYFYSFTFLLPAGWVNHAHALLLAGDNAGFIWLLPSIVSCAVGFFLLPQLRSSYRIQPLEDMVLPVGGNVNASDGRVEDGKDSQVVDRSSFVSDAAIARVKQQLLASYDWTRQGWLERISSAWLNHNEKVLTEFLMGGRVGKWSAAWMKGLYIALAGGAIWVFIPELPLWFGVAVIAGSAMFCAPVLGGKWLGFYPIRLGMKASFVAALYPVDYWNVSKVILKVNITRLLAWSIMALPIVTLLAIRFGLTLQQAEFFGIRMLLLILMIQFPIIVGLHSSGTNDTRTFTLRAATLTIGAAIYVIGILVVFAAFCAPDAPRAWAMAATGLVPCSILVWWLYGFFYSRGRVDLIHDPKEV